MKRRHFLTVLRSALAWPLAAPAQRLARSLDHAPHVGILDPGSAGGFSDKLAINIGVTKALGAEIPQSVLARADEVIE